MDPAATAPAASSKPRGLVHYQESLADEIFAFQREAYPRRRPDWIEPRWRWMFLESAQRLGVSPMVWLYRGKDGVVAHQGAIPARVQIGQAGLISGWFVETMVLESVRGKTVGPMLVAKAKEELPFNLSLGQTSRMRELQFALGWVEVAPLETYAYILNGRAVVRGKIGVAAAEAVIGAGVRLAQALRARRRGSAGRVFSTAAVTRFDASYTALWNRLRPEFPCAVVRDAPFLNWKYCDQPGQEYERLAVFEGGAPVALAVFKTLPADGTYRYSRAAVVEIVAPPSQGEVVHALLDAVCRRAGARGADLVTMDLLHPRLEGLVRDFGFVSRGSTRVFLVSTDSLNSELKAAVLKADRWLLTGGDSDIDRPW